MRAKWHVHHTLWYLRIFEFEGRIEYRPKLGMWDVLVPVTYGRTQYPRRVYRTDDLFAAISRALNHATTSSTS